MYTDLEKSKIYDHVGIREEDDKIVAISTEGQELEAAIIVGCDGLKSMTRHILLLKKGVKDNPPSFTGIAVVCHEMP